MNLQEMVKYTVRVSSVPSYSVILAALAILFPCLLLVNDAVTRTYVQSMHCTVHTFWHGHKKENCLGCMCSVPVPIHFHPSPPKQISCFHRLSVLPCVLGTVRCASTTCKDPFMLKKLSTHLIHTIPSSFVLSGPNLLLKTVQKCHVD